MAIHFYSDIHLNANKIGRDADNLIDFSTDNEITLRTGASNGITIGPDTVTFTSANADDPNVIIQNTTNDAQGARLTFKKHRGVDAVDGDNLGEIEFWGYDDGTPSEQIYGKIVTEVHDATSGQESGSMAFVVASHDGGQNTGLKLTGGSVDNEVDVEIGRGAASVTAVQGVMSVVGNATLAGFILDGNTITGVDDSGEFTDDDNHIMTSAGINDKFSVIAGSASITTVGTISTGTWQGTAIASAYLDADTAHLTTAQTFTGVKTFGTTTKLQFRDANAYINSPTANDIEIAATTITLDAATDIQLEQNTTVTGDLAATGKVTSVNDYGTANYEDDTTLDPSANGHGRVLKYSPGSGTSLTAGQIYYLETTGIWTQADADNVAKGGSQLLCVGLGDPRTAGVFMEGFITIPGTEILNMPGSGAVDGLPLYVSTTDGHFDFTAPSGSADYVRIVGYAIDDATVDETTNVLVYFCPSKDHILLA